jgi:hypothetical protein
MLCDLLLVVGVGFPSEAELNSSSISIFQATSVFLVLFALLFLVVSHSSLADLLLLF